MQKFKKYFPKLLLAALGICAIFIWYAVFYFESRGNLTVTFFDVGQGDSIFIESAEGYQVLIDGGPSARVVSKIGRRMPFWDRTLDLIVLTHPDNDHIAGLVEVLKRYSVDGIVWTGVKHSSAIYQEWMRLVEEKKVPEFFAQRGYVIHFGNGARFEILAPSESFKGKSAKKINDTSIVGMLIHGDNTILLTGDSEKSTEYRLLFELPQAIDADILKVGHHGSKTSSSQEFLRFVSPDIAIIQVGAKNRYGHPTQEVLDRLAAVGADVLRTDTEGDIIFVSDGEKMWRE